MSMHSVHSEIMLTFSVHLYVMLWCCIWPNARIVKFFHRLVRRDSSFHTLHYIYKNSNGKGPVNSGELRKICNETLTLSSCAYCSTV